MSTLTERKWSPALTSSLLEKSKTSGSGRLTTKSSLLVKAAPSLTVPAKPATTSPAVTANGPLKALSRPEPTLSTRGSLTRSSGTAATSSSSLSTRSSFSQSKLTNTQLASGSKPGISSAIKTERPTKADLTSRQLTSTNLTSSNLTSSHLTSSQLTSNSLTTSSTLSSGTGTNRSLVTATSIDRPSLQSAISTTNSSLTGKPLVHSKPLTPSMLQGRPVPVSTMTAKSPLISKSSVALSGRKNTGKPAIKKPTLSTTIKLMKAPTIATTSTKPMATTGAAAQLSKSLLSSSSGSKAAPNTGGQSRYIAVIEESEELPVYDFTQGPLGTPQFHVQFSSQGSVIDAKSMAALPDVIKFKLNLVQTVATSLLASPDYFNRKDPTGCHLRSLAKTLSHYDGEFLLKVALYTRCDLNIRATANYLLAIAASDPAYRPHLKKYYSASVRLPSDWIEIAEMYQSLHDKSINFGSLPTALRKVMSKKFVEFDGYQLAKYNKDTSKKKNKRNKKGKKENTKTAGPVRSATAPAAERPKSFASAVTKPVPPKVKKSVSVELDKKTKDDESDDDSDTDTDSVEGESESESEEELERLKFTLKQIIRKIHISQPVDHVMCLVGKKYPETPEDFRCSGLPGTWDQDRAGKRMKLPIPETWETQVSLKGNKAKVWEELIDHKKLPFMAMLRNIRNLIIAGVSMAHHKWVIERLTDERAVVNSRQFPFRFFSAYEVLNQLENQSKMKPMPFPVQKRSIKPLKKPKKVKPLPEIDSDVIRRYRNALDTSLMIATYHNVQPIKGSTVVLCNAGSDMNKPCTTARGLGKPRTVTEIGVLLALMCKYACEKCSLCVYGNSSYSQVSLKEGTILHNMEQVLNIVTTDGLDGLPGKVPAEFLRSLLVDRVQVDNLILLTNEMNMESHDGKGVLNFLEKYRHVVNPNLLFVSIDLSGRSVGVASTVSPSHPNNIHLSGYSDKILQFIAERSDSGQLVYIERIDEAYKLKDTKAPALLPPTGSTTTPSLSLSAPQTKWRTARIFISSTFRDMHGERDLLTRYVFPELRRRAHDLRVYLYEVDLRWGVTEEDTKHHKAIEICMTEISKSNYFIGILGQRYGWCPGEYSVPDSEEYDWIRDYPKGRSITELEMYHGALADPDKVAGKAFFYFRDKGVMDEIPTKYIGHFKDESFENEEKIESLKSKIRTSGIEVFDNYPSHWMGVVQNKPMLSSLEDFGKRVINNLWNTIQRDYPLEEEPENPYELASELNEEIMVHEGGTFIGRRSILHEGLAAINESKGVVLFTGKPGSGKTAFMAEVAEKFSEDAVSVHFVGTFPGSSSISFILSSICWEAKKRFSIKKPIPGDYLELAKEWITFIQTHQVSNYIVFIDGVELLDDENNGRSLNWIPTNLPDNVTIVLSVNEGSSCLKILKKRDPPPKEVIVGNLDMSDKADIVRSKLAHYRKELDESPFNNQMKLLLTKREAGNPLYLLLACEELRMFGVYEEVGAFLKKLPTTTAGLLQDVLSRLEEEHGAELVSSALTILCLVRDGLKETEMANILSLLFSNPSTGGKGRVPPSVLARLIRSMQTFLQPYQSHASETLILSHKEIEKAVKSRYLRGAGADRERQLHKIIAQYFRSNIDPTNDLSFTGTDTHSFNELPYHLVAAGDWKELETIACNLKFAVQKSQLGLSRELMNDYNPSLANVPAAKAREVSRFLQLPKVVSFKEFISRNLHILVNTPSLALQQAVNEPESSIVCNEAKELLAKASYPLVYWINKPTGSSSCKMTIPSHGDPALTIAVSPDGRSLVTGHKSSIIRIYDTDAGKEIKSLVGHSSSVNCLCFVSQDRLCSASHDNTLSLWNLTEGFRLSVLKGHTRSVRFCSASANGKNLVSVSWDKTIRVWRGTDGSLVSVLKGGRSTSINCLSFHPEGQLIVTGCWDSTLRIWDTFNKKKLKTLKGHASSVQACLYLKSGQHIVSASLDGDVRIWSSRTGITVGTINGHAGPITSLSFSSTGDHLITGSNDSLVKVWSGTMGTPIGSLGNGGVNGSSNCMSYDAGSKLVTVGYQDGSVVQYHIQTEAEVFHHRVHSGPVKVIIAQGGSFMTGSGDQTLKIWTPSSLPKAVSLEAHTGPITAAVWTKQVLVSAGEDFIMYLWPSDTSRHLSKSKIPSIEPVGKLTGHTGLIASMSISIDGMTLASVSHDKSIMIWNMLSKKCIHTIQGAHPDWINSCCFTKSGPELLITGSNDFNIKVWDTSDWKLKATLKGHTSAVNTVSSSNGCIVSGSSDGLIKVWTRKGVKITTLKGHSQRVNSVTISSLTGGASDELWGETEEEGEGAGDIDPSLKSTQSKKELSNIIILSTSDEGTVNIWKPFIPNELMTLSGHSDRVLAVTCSQSDTIVTTSLDETIRVWRPALPQPERLLVASGCTSRAHVGPVTGVRLVKVESSGNILATTIGRDGYFMVHVHNETTPLSHLYKVRVSDKALTAVEMSKNLQVVVGSDTGEITVWKLTEKEYPSLVVTIPSKNLMGPAPISQVRLTNDRNFLIASSWNNQLMALHNGRRPVAKMEGHKDWVIDTCTVSTGSNQSTVYSIGVDQVMVEYPPPKPPGTGKGRKSASGPVTVAGQQHKIPVSTRTGEEENKVWPLAMTPVQDKYIAIADSSGQVHLWSISSKTFIATQTVHADGVSSITSFNQFLITGSLDSTIKMWSTEAVDKSGHLRQVGHFNWTSSIEAMGAIQGQEPGEAVIMGGDCTGGVTLLKWK
ncbi:PREDICTED: telomerase protein component 1-like [Amphimedon queenslandica]|nr:PREDICTED: telomerase protein component 1-like [Amphimedon queenslandica]XP_019856164.1 PREDICTED: telomerase protein component 1-like [Amphimedon queenslandica]|eukprot:XP_011406078.1 PREDICTED: telomerase protein component 1-like [Amphimedon queenslandica]